MCKNLPISTPPLFLQDSRQITKVPGSTRYRLRMSDGRHLWSGKYLKLAIILIDCALFPFIFQRCTSVCVCFMCSVPARHTIKLSFGREPFASTLCVFAQEDHSQHIIRWQVCSFIRMCLPSSLLPLQYVFATFLCPFRRVVVILDMEILQSAEKSGGLIGNPTTYKESMIFIM